MMASDSWHGLRTGDQIGNLEYLVDERALAEYRRVVGGDGCFPNVMAEDCRAMLTKHCAGAPLSTLWQRLHFLRPPIPGRRVQVGGWVREISAKCGQPWIRASAFAVDDIGTEILRSEAAFVVGQAGAQPERVMVERFETKPQGINLSGSRAGDGGCLGELCLPTQKSADAYLEVVNQMAGINLTPDPNGMTSVAAGWLEALMGAHFGDDFRWGGGLAIAYHRALTPGMELRCDAVVLGHDTDALGVQTRRVVLSVRNAGDNRVATAEAVVKSPSPHLI